MMVLINMVDLLDEVNIVDLQKYAIVELTEDDRKKVSGRSGE